MFQNQGLQDGAGLDGPPPTSWSDLIDPYGSAGLGTFSDSLEGVGGRGREVCPDLRPGAAGPRGVATTKHPNGCEFCGQLTRRDPA